MASRILTAADIIEFYESGADLLADCGANFCALTSEDITEGEPEAYNYVTTESGTEVRILNVRANLADWFPDAVNEDTGKPEISEAIAAEIAEIINADAGLVLAAAIADEAEARVQADNDIEVAQASALRRAQAVARVVELCGGNQTEAARRLGIDQSRVSRLAAKATNGG